LGSIVRSAMLKNVRKAQKLSFEMTRGPKKIMDAKNIFFKR
jgi:cold shock CspA family protein